MSTADNPGDAPKLTDLEPMDTLEPVEEVAELEELEELAESPAATASGSRSDAAGASGAPREVEKAPMMLRKAGLILTIAAILPWLKPGGWDGLVLAAKGLVLLGGWLHYQKVLLDADEKVPGFIKSLGGTHHKALDLLGFALIGVGLAPLIDPWSFQGIVEKAAVAIGLLTWVQVHAYEKGGKFNPVMGLTMPLLAIAAIGRIVTTFKQFDPWAVLGSAGVLVAGGLAGYTMYVAMKEAKAHGEAKKKAALEERKRQRAAKKKSPGGAS